MSQEGQGGDLRGQWQLTGECTIEVRGGCTNRFNANRGRSGCEAKVGEREAECLGERPKSWCGIASEPALPSSSDTEFETEFEAGVVAADDLAVAPDDLAPNELELSDSSLCLRASGNTGRVVCGVGVLAV